MKHLGRVNFYIEQKLASLRTKHVVLVLIIDTELNKWSISRLSIDHQIIKLVNQKLPTHYHDDKIDKVFNEVISHICT